jgi:hypothetical protein
MARDLRRRSRRNSGTACPALPHSGMHLRLADAHQRILRTSAPRRPRPTPSLGPSRPSAGSRQPGWTEALGSRRSAEGTASSGAPTGRPESPQACLPSQRAVPGQLVVAVCSVPERRDVLCVMALVWLSGLPQAGQRAERMASHLAFPRPAEADIFSMTSHVGCVALLEPAGKGS